MPAAKDFSAIIDEEAQGAARIVRGAHGIRSGPTTSRRTFATPLSLCVGGARFVVESGNQLTGAAALNAGRVAALSEAVGCFR